MGMIGRWIDERCKAEPEVMRRVLGRKFGDLGEFIGADDKCGCLVGSWLIESGRVNEWYESYHYNPLQLLYRAESVGLEVAGLAGRLKDRLGIGEEAADKIAIRIIKQRIRKSLGLAPVSRETAVAVEESR